MSGVLQGIGGGVVGREFGLEVTEDSDANGILHGAIVLEHVTEAEVLFMGSQDFWWTIETKVPGYARDDTLAFRMMPRGFRECG